MCEYPPTWRSAPADPYGGGHICVSPSSYKSDVKPDEKKKAAAMEMIDDPIAYFMTIAEEERRRNNG